VFLSGCIPSLQPFYTEQDLIFEPGLVGSFSEPDGSAVWTFSKAADREYRLVIKDRANSSSFSAHLFKLANHTYLDLYPGKDGLDDCPREDFFKASLVPGHLVLKIPQIQPNLKLQVMDEDWIKEQLKMKKQTVPHSLIESDRLVLTGRTEEIQAFLKKISDEEKAWGKPAEFQKRDSK